MKIIKILLTLTLLGLSGCSGLLYFPDHKVHYAPEKQGYEKVDVTFKSKNGAKLTGWFFPAKNPKGTIVQFHGNGENMSSHYLTLAWLVEEGYNLFAFDYQGYGDSEGSPSPQKTYEDGVAAIEVARGLHAKSGAKKFIVYAQSLGVPIALKSVEDEFREDLVVLDSGFLSYKAVFSQTLSKNWLTFPASWIPYLTISDEYSPKESIGKLPVKILVIHDRFDPVIKFKNGKEIIEKASSSKHKDLWVTEQGYHIAIFFIENKRYRQLFLDYMDNLE